MLIKKLINEFVYFLVNLMECCKNIFLMVESLLFIGAGAGEKIPGAGQNGLAPQHCIQPTGSFCSMCGRPSETVLTSCVCGSGAVNPR